MIGKYGVLLIAVGLLTLLSTPLAAQDTKAPVPPFDQQAFKASRDRMVDILFPNSASWTPYSKLERVAVSASDLARLHDLLAEQWHFTSSAPGELRSFLKSIASLDFRVLPTPGRTSRILDCGPDLVGLPRYIVWLNYPDGPLKIGSIGGRLVRVSADARTRVVGINGDGVSGDQHEVFFRGDLWDTDNLEAIELSLSLQIPADAVAARYVLQAGSTALRYDPHVDDTPSPNLDAPIPPIGNVVRRLPFANFLHSYLYHRAADGSEWFLVRVGREDERNSSDIDFNASSELAWINLAPRGKTSALDWVSTNQPAW